MERTNDIVLERLKVGARTALSPQMAHDLEVRMFEDVVSLAASNMILEMRSTVYAHRVDVDDQIVPFSKTVRVGGVVRLVPRVWLPHALTAIASVVGAVVFSSPAFALVAIVSAAIAIANRKPAVVEIEGEDVTVEGEVKVRAKFFNTFPDNTVVYPASLGSPVRIVQLDPPDVYYRHTDDLRGDADR